MNRYRKFAVVTALGGSLLTASATPATAFEAEQCGRPSLNMAEDCACMVVGLAGEILDPGGQWGCVSSPRAT
jgi:hypothetical protein